MTGHLAVVGVIGVVLFTLPKTNWRTECALATCFMLLLTPHLLLYDLLFLAVPAVFVLRQNWKLSAALVVACSPIAMPLYTATNLSLTPILLVAVTCTLAGRMVYQKTFQKESHWRQSFWRSIASWLELRKHAATLEQPG